MKWLLAFLPLYCQAQYIEVGSNRTIEATISSRSVGLTIGADNRSVIVSPRLLVPKKAWLLNLQPGVTIYRQQVDFYGKAGVGYKWRWLYGIANVVISGHSRLTENFSLSLGLKLWCNGRTRD